MVEQLLNKLDLGQQLLNDSAEGLVDGVVVDAGEVVVNLDLLILVGDAELADEASHVLRDLVEHVELLIVLLEKIRVYFVDKHFERNVWVYFVGHLYNFVQLVAGGVFVGLMSIDDVNKGSARSQNIDVLSAFLIKLFGTWKVQNLELNVWVVIRFCN